MKEEQYALVQMSTDYRCRGCWKPVTRHCGLNRPTHQLWLGTNPPDTEFYRFNKVSDELTTAISAQEIDIKEFDCLTLRKQYQRYISLLEGRIIAWHMVSFMHSPYLVYLCFSFVFVGPLGVVRCIDWVLHELVRSRFA